MATKTKATSPTLLPDADAEAPVEPTAAPPALKPPPGAYAELIKIYRSDEERDESLEEFHADAQARLSDFYRSH